MKGATFGTAEGIGRFRPISLVVVLLASLSLVACGVGDEDDPTPVPTSPPAATSAAPAASVPAAATASPSDPGTSATGSPAAMANTVGRLAEGIAAAWPQTSYLKVQTSTEAPAGTPIAGPPALTITDEVLYPGSVHRTIVDESGVTSAEFILVDGRLYARGELVSNLFAPGTPPETWIEVTGPLLDPGTAGSNILSQLQALFMPRYSTLSPEEQAREAILASETSVNGTACFVFKTAETTQTGERLEIGIALAPDGRLCSVTTSAPGLETVETYTYDAPFTIEAPAVVATPAAGTPVVATPESSSAATPAT